MQKTAFARAYIVRSRLMFCLTIFSGRVRNCLTTKTLLAMKLTCLLLLISMLKVSANGFAQSTISLTGKDIPMKKVFAVIKQQTGYYVICTREVLQEAKPVSVNVEHMSLTDFLDMVLKNQPLKYTIDKKTVLISEKQLSRSNLLMQYAAPPADTAAFPVTGTVTDADGKPLAGATVMAKGSNLDVSVTGSDGKFTINVKKGDKVTVSFIGYEEKTWQVKNADDIIVFSLKQAASELDDVEVVSTGYQTLPRERATGSFGIVKAAELAKIPSTSLYERLLGQVAGVDISTATIAGKTRNGSIRIRGYSTIPGYTNETKVSLDPLLVIDGFQSQLSISDGALDYLNPDDIEQITFLKDAAAASIWGMQAANGVVVVVTKKGVSNSKPNVSFSATYGTSGRPRMDYYPINAAADYIDLENEHIEKGRFTDPVPRSNPGSYYPPNVSQAQWAIFNYQRGDITEAQKNEELARLSALDNRSQISEYLLQPTSTQQYNLSVSGGGPRSSFYISGYFYQDEPVYKSNVNKGYTLNANNTASLLKDRVTLTTGLSYSNKRDKLNMAAVTALSTTPGGLRPYDMLKDENGRNIYYDIMVISPLARTLEGLGYLPFGYSPIDELNYSNTISNGNNVTLNLGLNTKVTDWLSVNLNGNIGRIFNDIETYDEPDSYEARRVINTATGLYPTYITNGLPKGGRQVITNSQNKTYNLRGTININKSWNNKHQVNILAGSEIREAYSKSGRETRYGVDKAINAFRSVSVGASYRDIYSVNQPIPPTTTPVTEFTTRSLSYYGNGSYTFLGKYIISASARFDDFNLLGVDRRKRAIPLWSSGVKWNVSKESFMQNLHWLDNLSVRATLGFSGNAPQGFAPVTVVSILGAEYYSGMPYATIGRPAMENLSWEKTRMTNLGLDFSVLKNRVYGSAELYYKKSTDIIWNLPINGTYGFSSLLFNTANLHGKGVDLSISGVPVSTKNLRWTTTLNLSWNTNIIKDYRFDQPVISFDARTLYDGYPFDYLFSYQWVGLDSTGQSLILDPADNKTVYNVNEFVYKDIRVYSGRTTSPWFGGFNNTFRYKGFELSTYFSFNFGGVFRKPSANDIGYSNNGFVGRNQDIALRWRQPGDEAFTNVPGLVFGANTNFNQSIIRYNESDLLVRSRSNIKWRQLSLSYSIPAALAAKAGLKGLSISGIARELGLVWAKNKEGLDPEYLYSSGGGFQLPPSVKYTFRITASF